MVGFAWVGRKRDRKSVVWGESVMFRVDLGGRRSIKKKIGRLHNLIESRNVCLKLEKWGPSGGKTPPEAEFLPPDTQLRLDTAYISEFIGFAWLSRKRPGSFVKDYQQQTFLN
jgi:hypothetical protein